LSETAVPSLWFEYIPPDAGDSPADSGWYHGVSREMLNGLSNRFHEQWIDGLHGAARPGGSMIIDETAVQPVLNNTCKQGSYEET